MECDLECQDLLIDPGYYNRVSVTIVSIDRVTTDAPTKFAAEKTELL